MTKEDAINLLKQVNEILVNNNSWLENTHEPLNQAFDMAIKSLEQQPTDDCVSRRDTLKKFEDRFIELQKAHQMDKQLGVNWCINTLKDMPPVTPIIPTCEDCVSRTQALSAIRNLYPNAPFIRANWEKWREKNKKYIECEDIIKALPPVTPTRKQGKWDKGYGFPDGAYWKCSCCNELIKVRYPMNFCPNCGASFKEEKRGNENG